MRFLIVLTIVASTTAATFTAPCTFAQQATEARQKTGTQQTPDTQQTGEQSAASAQPKPDANVTIWSDLAPGEQSAETGTRLDPRPSKSGLPEPPITRVKDIRMPTMDVFFPAKPSGVCVLILPGGGFNYVVPDLEGSEAAAILNGHGITACVLRYRTKRDATDPGWSQALQDAQRAMKVVRRRAVDWKVDPQQIGILGFSAGGQVTARLLGDNNALAYDAVDATDQLSHRPAFAMLVYPWNMYDAKADRLLPEIKVNDSLPPTFIVHTDDDRSSSLGSVLLYAELKKAGVSAELHVYQNGGHGYGVRSRERSNIGSWPDRMIDWLRTREIIHP